MFKVLVSLALCMIIVFFYFDEKNSILPVFQLTEAPTVITKGQYGASLIVEVSYSHEGFEEWVASLSKPYPLFLVDTDWILRSPEAVKLLIERNIPLGLLGSTQSQYEENDSLLDSQLTIFQKNFQQLPLWFATRDYTIGEPMQQNLHERGINLVAPTYSFVTPNTTIVDGDFISIPLHREQEVSFQEIQQYLKTHPFVSIEQNLFGYDIATKRLP
ncbi:hypothetical protein LZ480_17235 [Solibacillus sp. MA9]|uniref:NodB homology domain-containing protein n=1 Tax=Solibacillus palustris TaxID=2908203 RepID=A0ABS9UGX9_9BACL|nr:hypothetical protein [Solibacillus sp. MA9]MCH7323624.1 hypothetical protein [Solibacillus sp. MA9]